MPKSKEYHAIFEDFVEGDIILEKTEKEQRDRLYARGEHYRKKVRK